MCRKTRFSNALCMHFHVRNKNLRKENMHRNIWHWWMKIGQNLLITRAWRKGKQKNVRSIFFSLYRYHQNIFGQIHMLKSDTLYWLKFTLLLQVNNYEIVIKFFHISHDLTWYSEIAQRFTRISKFCSTYEVTKQFMEICVKNCAINLKKNNL